VRINQSDLASGNIRLRPSGGNAYFSATTHAVLPATTSLAVQDGFDLKRVYLDYETGKQIRRIKAGELVKVRLDIRLPEYRDYVALRDPLPAGLEVVNSTLKTARKVQRKKSWAWEHIELKDDEVRAYANRPWRRELRFEYVARATIVGTFHALPAHVETMYDPNSYARSDATTLVVDP